MSAKDIVHSIMNKDFKGAREQIQNELNTRSFQSIQDMKPEVMRNAFKNEEPIEESYTDEAIDEFVENSEDYGFTLEEIEEADLDEGIAKTIGKGIKKAAKRLSTSGRADAAEKKADKKEKKAKDKERLKKAKERIKSAKGKK